MYMIFVNLLVQDMGRAREFYEGLGFRPDQHSSNEKRAAYIVDDKIVISLVAPDSFSDLLNRKAGQVGQGPVIINCLNVQHREDVDEMLGRARSHGADTWTDKDEQVGVHSGSFSDSDGHVWRIDYLEPLHVID